MLKVGITGGIGSGKSLVAGIFRLLGVAVYDSDNRAKEIMHDNVNVRQEIKDLFGSEAYLEEGSLNRDFIAGRVFADKGLLAQLNAIVHPAVGVDFKMWCEGHADVPYILKEAALIFEAGIDKSLDKVVLIFAPEDLRVSRVMQRDQVDEKSVQSRIANQWNDKQKAQLSDYIIINDGEHSLLRQTLEIHNLLTEYARNPAK